MAEETLSMRKLLTAINMWRVLPVWMFIKFASTEQKNIIMEELYYWNKCLQREKRGILLILSELLIEHKEYRNLLERRMIKVGGVQRCVFSFLFPLKDTLEICSTEIGRCLFIQHGFATNISAKSIGDFCWINQQVTIGWNFNDEPPVIGNGVRICAGAKVLGKIKVDDNAIIAANAVVVRDVGQQDIVGGVPAKVVGRNTEHLLYTNGKVLFGVDTINFL